MNEPNLASASSTALPQTLSVKVIGVGGAGLAAVKVLQADGSPGLRLAGVHTDARQVSHSPLPEKLLLGANLTRGLGAGGDPQVARAAGEADALPLRELAAGYDLVIIVAGLGRGTGSGAAPVAARLARESGALVLAFAILPFDFEGLLRHQQAQQALHELKLAADAVICLPNQKVAGLLDENTTLPDTFLHTNRLLADGIRGIRRLLTREGLIPVSFSDLCRVLRGRQTESCFVALEGQGEQRVRDVLEQLFASPMLDQGQALDEADALLVSLVGGPDLKRREVEQLLEQINRHCESAQVVVGAIVDPQFTGRLAVTVVATQRHAVEVTPEPEPVELPPPASEFPTSEEEVGDSPLPQSGRPQFRYVAPPPVLTPELRDRLIKQQKARGSSQQRRQAARLRQQMLPLDVVSKGRFARSEPTIHQGEDLDTPTYLRKGVALN